MDVRLHRDLVHCGYWRRHHHHYPINNLISIIDTFGLVPEKFAKGGNDLEIDADGYTVHHTLENVPVWPEWSDDSKTKQTVFLNMNGNPHFGLHKSWKWTFEFAWPIINGKGKSCFLGLTSKAEMTNWSPHCGKLVNRGYRRRGDLHIYNGCYFGFEFDPKARWNYDPNDLNATERYFIQPVTIYTVRNRIRGAPYIVDDPTKTCGDWNNPREIWKTDDENGKEYDYVQSEYIFGEVSFELYKEYYDTPTDEGLHSGHSIKIEISEYPNKLHTLINSSYTYRLNSTQFAEYIKNLGLALTISRGCIFVLKNFDFGDCLMEARDLSDFGHFSMHTYDLSGPLGFIG